MGLKPIAMDAVLIAHILRYSLRYLIYLFYHQDAIVLRVEAIGLGGFYFVAL